MNGKSTKIVGRIVLDECKVSTCAMRQVACTNEDVSALQGQARGRDCGGEGEGLDVACIV